MSKKNNWRWVRIGILVASAMIVAALAIVGVTSSRHLFERKVVYFSLFPDAGGLKEGSGVWYQGVEVGFVTSVEFNENPDLQDIKVTYKISSKLVPRVRTGTRASIKTLGLLGDKYLSLNTKANTADQPIILPKHQIPIDRSLNLNALGKGAQSLMDSTTDLSNNINVLVNLINHGKGVLPRFFNDPELGRKTVKTLNSIGNNLAMISSYLASGRGLGGKLLTDRAYGNELAKNLAESVKRTNQILTDLQSGKGGAGELLSKGGKGEEIVSNLALTSEALSKAAASLERPGTLGNKLFMDDEYNGKLAENLLSISSSLASILKKVDDGDGTLGALVNDRSVYDSLSAVADGIQKSAIVKWYLKRKAEKAAKEAKKTDMKG